jgi:hypothetical protein
MSDFNGNGDEWVTGRSAESCLHDRRFDFDENHALISCSILPILLSNHGPYMYLSGEIAETKTSFSICFCGLPCSPNANPCAHF